MNTKRAAIGIFYATVVLVIAALVLGLIAGFDSPGQRWFVLGIALIAIVYVGAGTLLVVRGPQSPIGWIVICIGFFQMTNMLTSGYAAFALGRSGAPLAFGDISEWASMWTWIPSVGALVTFLPLLFPDGHPPSPRWRIVRWVAGLGITLDLLGNMAGDWPIRHAAYFDQRLQAVGVGLTVSLVGSLIVAVASVASFTSLVVRYRRARGEERQQLRWFIFAAVVVLVGVFLAVTVDTHFVVLLTGFFLIPITAAVAILKYRLYELDVVIKKTVVFTVVAAVLTALYLAVVALATVGAVSKVVVGVLLLAVTFNPVRRAARVLADRIVYGKRATSYEVLTEFSERMGETYATDDVLPRMSQILKGATGANSATVWLAVGDELRPTVSGADGSPPPVRAAGDALPDLPGDFAAEVRHQGELLGALSVRMPANQPLDAGREKLVRDLASQAGLVLRNVRLIEELKASRQRLVAAQDEERRKLERNIHDGAQQQLVALAVKQRLVAALVGKDDERARAMLEEIQADTTSALEDLRDLARGIYPPLLADKGLMTALEAQARKAALPVTVEGGTIGRFGQDVEAAVYFSCLEALQNIAKYADASHAMVRLSDGDGALTFAVTDDGLGFDPSVTGYGTGLQGMADRLAALGGALEVSSIPGSGTTVTGRLPAGVTA